MSTADRKVPAAVSTTSATPAVERAVGLWGWAFVALLLLSAGMATVPGGGDANAAVRDFYARNAAVVLVAQGLSLLASIAFAVFVLKLRRAGLRVERRGPPELAGLAVAAAGALTSVPVVWLAVAADRASDGLVHALAVASDLVDVLLFATIAIWSAALVAAAEWWWFTVLAGAVGLLALARAVLLVLGSDLLELVAPWAFLVFVALISTLVLFHRPPLPSAERQW
jgi:hypothetical protein